MNKKTYRILEEKGSTVQDWKGFEYTGELMEIKSKKGEITVFRIVKGKFTPSGGVRDCGGHYIKANFSSYDRIDKATMQVVEDAEDE